jgi:hypothetical protein
MMEGFKKWWGFASPMKKTGFVAAFLMVDAMVVEAYWRRYVDPNGLFMKKNTKNQTKITVKKEN